MIQNSKLELDFNIVTQENMKLISKSKISVSMSRIPCMSILIKYFLQILFSIYSSLPSSSVKKISKSDLKIITLYFFVLNLYIILYYIKKFPFFISIIWNCFSLFFFTLSKKPYFLIF